MKLTILIAIAALVAYVDCHARLANPVGRQGIFRLNEDLPFTEELEWCYDPVLSPGRGNVKCGICGPIYNNDPTSSFFADGADLYSFERGSPIYTGLIAKTYKKNSIIRVTVDVEVMHDGGLITVAIADAANADPTQATLDKNLLTFIKNGKKTIDMREGTKDRNLRTFAVQLPAELTCEHCLLQWYWRSNDAKQHYAGCSDVRITGTSTLATTTPSSCTC